MRLTYVSNKTGFQGPHVISTGPQSQPQWYWAFRTGATADFGLMDDEAVLGMVPDQLQAALARRVEDDVHLVLAAQVLIDIDAVLDEHVARLEDLVAVEPHCSEGVEALEDEVDGSRSPFLGVEDDAISPGLVGHPLDLELVEVLEGRRDVERLVDDAGNGGRGPRLAIGVRASTSAADCPAGGQLLFRGEQAHLGALMTSRLRR